MRGEIFLTEQGAKMKDTVVLNKEATKALRREKKTERKARERGIRLGHVGHSAKADQGGSQSAWRRQALSIIHCRGSPFTQDLS